MPVAVEAFHPSLPTRWRSTSYKEALLDAQRREEEQQNVENPAWIW